MRTKPESSRKTKINNKYFAYLSNRRQNHVVHLTPKQEVDNEINRLDDESGEYENIIDECTNAIDKIENIQKLDSKAHLLNQSDKLKLKNSMSELEDLSYDLELKRDRIVDQISAMIQAKRSKK